MTDKPAPEQDLTATRRPDRAVQDGAWVQGNAFRVAPQMEPIPEA